MRGLTIHSSTNTNHLHLTIPDELKGIELQIIILPASQVTNEPIDFFTDDELQQLPAINLGSVIQEDEDYTKW